MTSPAPAVQVYGLPFGVSRALGRWWRAHRDRAARACLALVPRCAKRPAHPPFQEGA